MSKGVVLAALAVSMLAISARSEAGGASGTGRTISQNVLARVSVEDTPGHELIQSVGLDEMGSPDPIGGVSFQGGQLHRHDQWDVVAGSGVVRGYGVWQAPGGEKLFLVYGYAIPPFPDRKDELVPFEGSFQWIGGTGRLENIAGTGTLQGEISRTGKATYRWNGTFQSGEQ